MNTCIAFCAAEFDRLAEPVDAGDFLLAVDGGLSHLQRLGLKPDGIIGDFDSLGYIPEGASIFPVEKDDTDAMLAARQGLRMGYRRFVFYGGLDGPRLDHTIANFQMLQFLAEHGAAGYLVGRTYLATVLKDGSMTFPAHAAGILSVFCMGADATGVTLRNLQYPLENHRLCSGFPLGVSNHFVGRPAQIAVDNGCLLVLWDRANGFPQR